MLKRVGHLLHLLDILKGWKHNKVGVKDWVRKNGFTEVTIVGSNPGKRSPDCSAFHPATKSRKTVDSWFKEENVRITYMNLVDYKTKDNKPLKKSEIVAELDKIRNKFANKTNIIACGKVASMGLNLAGMCYYEMPHPSGLCRIWNDDEKAKKIVGDMIKWVKN
jgi:hypothetical protein